MLLYLVLMERLVELNSACRSFSTRAGHPRAVASEGIEQGSVRCQRSGQTVGPYSARGSQRSCSHPKPRKWTRLEFWIDKKNLLSENSKLFGTWCTVFGDWRQRHPHTHLQLLHGRRWELPGDHSDWLRRVPMDGERNVKRKTAPP
jgi:hypothetical protein